MWHLPLIWTQGLYLHSQPLWLLLIDITAKSVLFTWVFLDTNGSVLVAALFHAATNVFLVSPTNPVGDDLTFRWSPSGSNGSWPCWCSPGATGPERLTFEASPFAGVTDRVR